MVTTTWRCYRRSPAISLIGGTYLRDVSTLKTWCDKAGSAYRLHMNFESPCDMPPLEKMRPVVLAVTGALGLPVHAGEVFARAKIACPKLDLYYADRHHASAVGSYLIALTMAHDLFDVDVRSLPLSRTAAACAGCRHRRRAAGAR